MNTKNNDDPYSFTFEDQTYDAIVTFDRHNSHDSKSIIIYTDNTYDYEDRLNCYASYYRKSDQGIVLEDIDNDDDYETVEAVLDKVQETVRQGYDDKNAIARIISEYFNT